MVDLDSINQFFLDDKILVIDNVLDEGVLNELHDWCMESTVWHETEKVDYVGAYWTDGFVHPLLLKIALDMVDKFEFLKGLQLTQAWGYNYHSNRRSGISLHADVAVVNINLWITPDDANLDSTSGGLIIYRKPLTGNETFQQAQNASFGYEYIRDSMDDRVVVPYKRNRIAIFESNLYHETDTLNFKPGYKNRRINLTFLFGTSISA